MNREKPPPIWHTLDKLINQKLPLQKTIKMPRKLIKLLSLLLSFLLIFEQSGLAQVAGQIDVSGYFTQFRQGFIQDKFRPLHLRYLSYDNQANSFKLLLDKGDLKPHELNQPNGLNARTKELLNYFFIGISLPNSSFWVNLRPDSPDNIVDDDLAKTDVGRILLEADLQLKKDTARFTSPAEPEGREYWDKLYKKAAELFSTDNITIPTLTRPWIVPDEIIIRENMENGSTALTTSAYIYKATLKVMLEDDYLKSPQSTDHSPQYSFSDPRLKELNQYSTQLIQELIIPKLTKELNSSKRYAPLRQVYYSLILAQWFKSRFYGKGGLYSWLIDQKNLTGLISKDPWSKSVYFKQYQKSFQDGEYNLKEPIYTPFGQSIRSYISGGIGFTSETVSSAIKQGIILGNLEPPLNRHTMPIRVEGGGVSSPFGIKINGDTPEQKASSAISFWPWPKKVTGEPSWEPHKPASSREVKESRRTFNYSDPGQDFSGVSFEHFVVAQTRLAEQLLTDEELRRVLSHLGIKPMPSKDEAYKKIYQGLAQKGYSQEVIDLTNGLTYQKPRLEIDIIDQNENPRRQAVFEAIANSLDALGYNIGQFGKGVKQILDWLSPTGGDRIDVFTKERGGLAYQLTILKDTLGQEYLQIKEISLRDFQKAGAKDTEQGTIVKVTIQDNIPPTDKELDNEHRNSQQAIIEGIHKRFPFVTSVRITTQIGNDKPQEVNGFGTKEIIVPAQAPAYTPQESEGKDIRIKIDNHTITIMDNGKGMNAEILSRMFVSLQSTKHPESLSAKQAKQELKKVKVVVDTALANRVSFARNSEVVITVDIPEDVIPQATIKGGLMLEFGLLLDVPESRDEIRIPSNPKPGELSHFQLAVEYAVKQIITHPDLSNIEKVKYINTLVLGLEGLIQENPYYVEVLKNIRVSIRKQLSGIINSLRQEGLILLPHNKQFTQISLPKGKRALFLNKDLFNWRGALSLKEIGGEIIPGITLAGERRLPVVVIPFNKESLQTVVRFDQDWPNWEQGKRIPLIRTDSFIAFPEQFLGVQRLLELARKQAKGTQLSQEEEEVFSGLLQMVDIISAKEVVTSYELTPPPPNLTRALPKFVKIDGGEIDSKAISGFLTQPPPIGGVKRESSLPPDAGQRYVLLKNGEVIEIGTGRRVLSGVKAMEFLRNGYYKVIRESADTIGRTGQGAGPMTISTHTEIIKLENGNVIQVLAEKSFLEIIHLSLDKRFAYVQLGARYGEIESIFDLESGKKYSFENCCDLQFSQDGRYLTYRKDMPWLDSGKLMIVSMSSEGITEEKTIDLEGDIIMMGRHSLSGVGNYESAVNPLANVVFVQNTATRKMQLIDLETGTQVAPETEIKHLRTDSTGTYTVIVDVNNKISIAQFKKFAIWQRKNMPCNKSGFFDIASNLLLASVWSWSVVLA